MIVGCMFSGKTEELIKQVQRAGFAKQKWQAFKPQIDARYSENGRVFTQPVTRLQIGSC